MLPVEKRKKKKSLSLVPVTMLIYRRLLTQKAVTQVRKNEGTSKSPDVMETSETSSQPLYFRKPSANSDGRKQMQQTHRDEV